MANLNLSSKKFAWPKEGAPNLSLTMYPFSISTDELGPLKFLMTKYFMMNNHKSYVTSI